MASTAVRRGKAIYHFPPMAMIRTAMTLSMPLDPARDRLPAAPLDIHEERVPAQWIDYNGHMNVACYVIAFDHATDKMLDLLDLGVDYVKRTNCSTFVLETHVTYVRELKLDDPLHCHLRMLDVDGKRLHYYFEMFHDREGYLAATSEQILLHVDLRTRRAAPMPEIARGRAEALRLAQAGLSRPDRLCGCIGIRRNPG